MPNTSIVKSSLKSENAMRDANSSSNELDSDSSTEGTTVESPANESELERPSANTDSEDSPFEASDTSAEAQSELLGKLPPEIATLLVIAGVAGVLLPGPVGTPMLIAGGIALWPKTFKPIESWFSRRFPKIHQEGVLQIKEFLVDLEKRFPTKSTNK